MATPAAPARGHLSPEQQAEIARLHYGLNKLDYYELLGLPKTAAPGEIKKAFYAASRTWHPDRFYHLEDAVLKGRVHDLYKRITEAYAVLRDDQKRPRYIADVTGPERAQKLRYSDQSDVEVRQQKKKEAQEQIGLTPKGRQLYQAGVADLEASRWSQAERNLKMALTFEPQNARYKERLKEAQDKLLEESRRSGSQFRIK